jgi:hypothetical protein
MGGFLVMALAIPTAFEGSGATFAIGYAVVIVLHSGLYIAGSSDREAAAMLSITPFNVGAAALLIAGGVLGGDAHRRVFGTGDGKVRVTIALLAWPLFWLGTEVAGAALVAGLAALIAVGLAIEGRRVPDDG